MFKFGNTYHKLRFIEKKFKLQFFLGGLKFRKQNIRKEKRKKNLNDIHKNFLFIYLCIYFFYHFTTY